MASLQASALKAVVLDWAGTTVDHGSRAPVDAFIEAFSHFDVEVGVDEARAPMGLAKRDHIRALGGIPRIAEAWRRAHGRPFAETDVEAVLEVFIPRMVDVVCARAEPVPGAVDALAELRGRGLAIGSTTGYTRDIMEALLPLAAAHGVTPDTVVCAGETPAGRPTPMMMYRCFLDLGVWPAAACVKVDDTPPGIGEGLAAGAWTVGVAVTGNLFGLSAEETGQLSAREFGARRAAALRALKAAGAHYVIDGIADLAAVIDEIDGRLVRGERP